MLQSPAVASFSPTNVSLCLAAVVSGYIRGEGAGAALLKPAESAEEARCLRLAEAGGEWSLQNDGVFERIMREVY